MSTTKFLCTSPRDNPLSGANSPDWVMNNFTGVKTARVLRGGSWPYPRDVRVAVRDWGTPSGHERRRRVSLCEVSVIP